VDGIGIIGIGISGLQLGLHLQHVGIDTTLYTERPMEQLAAGPLPNTVTRWGSTLTRERSLDLLDPQADQIGRLRFRVPGTPIDIDGALSETAETTDFRMYLPRLLETYLSRGGRLHIGPCGPAQLPDLTQRHDLVVVAAGQDGFGGTFAIDATRSPYREPQRHWNVGLYDGITLPEGTDGELSIVPGVGEVLHARMMSFSGPVSVISIIALPQGPLGGLFATRWAQDRRGFVDGVRTALHTYVPHVHARLEERSFAPLRELDVLQGALTPTVRRAWAEVAGRYVLAVGDAWVVNDPIAAQGANVGSAAAFALGAAIAEGGPFDEGFARRTEAAMWAEAEAATTLSNVLLAPPSPETIDLLARASTEPALGDRVVDGLGHPEDMLRLFAGASAEGELSAPSAPARV